MYALIKPFVSLCLFSSKPQDLPTSDGLLRTTLFGYLLVGILLALPLYGLPMGLLQAFLELTLLIVFTRAVLQIAGHRERYTQTLIALAGTGAIFGLLSMPLVYSIAGQGAAKASAVDGFTLRTYTLILAWLVVVYGHVFRHALSSGILTGLLVALGYVILTSMVINTVLPPPDLMYTHDE